MQGNKDKVQEKIESIGVQLGIIAGKWENLKQSKAEKGLSMDTFIKYRFSYFDETELIFWF